MENIDFSFKLVQSAVEIFAILSIHIKEHNMKKLLVLLVSLGLFACSSGVSLDMLAAKMPKNGGSFMAVVPSDDAIVNTMIVGMIKASGSPSANNIMESLALDNANVGVAGNSQMVNKATALYALENAPKIGTNVGLYMIGDSENDKADLERAAKAKNVKLHYFFMK